MQRLRSFSARLLPRRGFWAMCLLGSMSGATAADAWTQKIIYNDFNCHQDQKTDCAPCEDSSYRRATLPACPVAAPTPMSNHGGTINPQTLVHLHEALDYQMPTSSAGCAPCGGGGPGMTNPLPNLEIRRFHRQREFASGEGGSLGTTGFLLIDTMIVLDRYSGHTPLQSRINLFDPSSTLLKKDIVEVDGINGDGVVNGVLRDREGEIRRTVLLDASNTPNADWLQTKRVEIFTAAGRKLVFEIMNLNTNQTDPTRTKRVGRLVRVEDADGNATVITYVHPVTATNAALGNDRIRLWQAATITDPFGRSASFTYGTTKVGIKFPVTSITMPDAGVVRYIYTGAQLTRVERPDLSVSTFAWTLDTSVKEPTNPLVSVALNRIDWNDSAAVGGSGNARFSSWVNVAVSRWKFNAADAAEPWKTGQHHGLIRRVADVEGNTRYIIWCEAMPLDLTVVPHKLFVYDADRGVFRMQVGDYGSTMTNVEQAISYDPAAADSTYTWGSAASYANNLNNLPTQVTDAFGQATTYAYQGRQATTITNPGGSVRSATYVSDLNSWAYGKPLTQVDELGRVTTYTYSPTGHLLTKAVGSTTATGPDGVTRNERSVWTWEYNTRGQMSASIDPRGNRTTYGYDGIGQLAFITEPKDDATVVTAPTRTFGYDGLGRLSSSMDASNRTTTYEYETTKSNRLKRVLYGDGTYEEVLYGTGAFTNQEAERRDRNGNRTTTAFDSNGRVTTRIMAAGKPEALVETCSYLPGSRLKAACALDGEKTTYTYDSRLRLSSVAVRANTGMLLTTTYGYDEKDRRVSVRDPYNRTTYSVYDIRDRLVRTIHELVPAGVPAGSTLATLARSTVANPPYVITDQQYDVAGQLAAVIDGRNIRTSRRYDSQGRQMEQIDAVGATEAAKTWFEYDAAGNLTKTTLPRTFDTGEGGKQFITTSTYNGRNRQASETVAVGLPDVATRSWTYTPTGKVASEKDFRDFPTTRITAAYTYSACCDRLIEVKDALGYISKRTYDGNGNVKTTTDANNFTTTFTYDGRNRQTGMTNHLSQATLTAYDDNLSDGLGLFVTNDPRLANLNLGTDCNGSAVQVTNALGKVQEIIIRDGAGRTVRSIDGNGLRQTVVHDDVSEIAAMGGVATRVTNPSNDVTSQYTDGAGRVRKVKDAELFVSTFTYDANGNQLSSRDANAIGQTTVYDSRNRAITVTDTATGALQSVTRATYDKHSNVKTQTDALLNVTSFVYDGRDRKTRSTDPLPTVTDFTYDTNSNLLTIVDGDSAQRPTAADRRTTYEYDERNLLRTETYPPSQQRPGITDKRSYTYDAARRLLTRVDQAGVTTTYGYDQANRLKTRTYSSGMADGFSYDAAGRLTQAVAGRYATTVNRAYDDGSRLTQETQVVEGVSRPVGYSYDPVNRATSVTYPDGRVITRTATKRGQLTRVSEGAVNHLTRLYDGSGRQGTSTLANGVTDSRTYQAGDHQLSTLTTAKGGTQVVGLSYGFDANKRKLWENDSLNATRNQAFGYDAANRLTTWDRDGQEGRAWTLSRVGDWLSASHTNKLTSVTTTETRTHTGVHEAVTRTVAGVTTPLTYDANGNLAVDEVGQRLVWDEENRLLSAGNGVATNSYRYDALGRRLASIANGKATTFVHDGAQVLVEYETPAFQSSTIGSPALGGSFSDNGSGTITVAAGGADIWGTSDQFRYAYVTMTGNGTITARVASQTNTDPSAKAGVMVRDSLAANARHVSLLAMPKGSLAFQSRTTAGGSTVNTGVTGVTVPVWLRLTRSGSTITAARSADGITWTAAGSDATAIPAATATIHVGLAVTAHNVAATSTATFTKVEITGNVQRTISPAQARAYVYGSYVDEPVAMITPTGTYYYHANHLYSVAAVTSSTGTVLERYRYDAYGQRTILAPDGVTVRTASSYGNQVGFTGRYLDKETGLWYFRARYYSGTLGRFVSRDALHAGTPGGGYHDGNNLYSAYYVPNAVDPSGEILAAIDGTGSRLFLDGWEWHWSWKKGWYLAKTGTPAPPLRGRSQSHVRNFYEDYRLDDNNGYAKRYWNGPDSTVWGTRGEVSSIQNEAKAWLCQQWCAANKCKPIDLVGHSRGGHVAMEVARALGREGCDCGSGAEKVQVRYLGLYDAVDSTLGYGISENIENVKWSASVLAAHPSLPNSTPLHVLGRPGYIGPTSGVRSRWYFNRVGENASAVLWLWATHAAIGGAPWTGDRPPGHSQANDEAQSPVADKFIRQNAISAGVSL